MALVLSRQVDEGIRIGDAVITVARIGRRNVRLAIEAPTGVPITRTELAPHGAPPATPHDDQVEEN
jgi:carbon storage regulator CsrA